MRSDPTGVDPGVPPRVTVDPFRGLRMGSGPGVEVPLTVPHGMAWHGRSRRIVGCQAVAVGVAGGEQRPQLRERLWIVPAGSFSGVSAGRRPVATVWTRAGTHVAKAWFKGLDDGWRVCCTKPIARRASQ